MAEHLIQDTTLTGIADKIRSLLGLTGKMSPAQMQTNLTTEQANITAALAALAEKGVEVPAGSNSNGLAGLIEAIEAGGGSKMYFEKTTFSADTGTYTLNHNLGEVPNICFYATLTAASSFGTKKLPAGLFVVLDNIMYYSCIGSSSSQYDQKGFAYVAGGTNGATSELIPVSGKSLVVPTAVTDSSLTLKGTWVIPPGDYLFCCGRFQLGG